MSHAHTNEQPSNDPCLSPHMASKPCCRPREMAACPRLCLSWSTCARARSMAVGSRVDAGARSARKAGETDERLFAVAAWREAPYFSDAERAALALDPCRYPA